MPEILMSDLDKKLNDDYDMMATLNCANGTEGRTTNINILQTYILENLRNESSFAIIPGELVPELFSENSDLVNSYAIYQKRK